MKSKLFLIYLILLVFGIKIYCQEKTHSLTFNISVAEEIKSSFNPEGRLFIFLSTTPNVQPMNQIWPNSITGRHFLFAKNFSFWTADNTLMIKDPAGWSTWGRTGKCSFDNVPEDTYYIQVLWQQNFYGIGINEEGNLYSKTQELVINKSQTLDIDLSAIIEQGKPDEHPYVKMVHYKSDTLSKWWGKPVYERAAVLLPSGYYDNPDKEYPIYYYIGGGQSDCLNIGWWMNYWKKFAEWWMSDESPQIIIVYLDGILNSNFYHLDSDNLGPHGHSLIYELIPYMEKLYRGTNSPDTRFVGGCSTGGYGSLALQLFYPETFNGVYCYSPDPISFTELMYINIYEDENCFYDEYGYPKMVNQLGRANNPISWKDWMEFENVLGSSGTYLDSDHVMGIWSGIFGPKGTDGKPVPLVDPLTGTIDYDVAESWSRYDLSRYIVDNWEDIGPKLQNKIYISCNTSDFHFLDRAVSVFERNLAKLDNPTPDVIIDWAPGEGHCNEYNKGFPHMEVLKQIEKRIKEMDTTE